MAGSGHRVALDEALDPLVVALDVGSTASRGDVYDATGRPVEGGRRKVAHTFRAGDRGLTFLAYGTRESNDICFYPRSGKVFFRGVNLVARIESLDYWDGEE